jgi:hypothetical protein
VAHTSRDEDRVEQAVAAAHSVTLWNGACPVGGGRTYPPTGTRHADPDSQLTISLAVVPRQHHDAEGGRSVVGTMTLYAEVPLPIVRRVRSACARLPEAYEELAFPSGVRWRIRTRTLVHVVTIDDELAPVTVMWFHASPEEIDVLLAVGDPFFPGWDRGLVGMVLREDGTTDWTEVEEVLIESYCLLAPKKLIARLGDARPDL